MLPAATPPESVAGNDETQETPAQRPPREYRERRGRTRRPRSGATATHTYTRQPAGELPDMAAMEPLVIALLG